MKLRYNESSAALISESGHESTMEINLVNTLNQHRSGKAGLQSSAISQLIINKHGFQLHLHCSFAVIINVTVQWIGNNVASVCCHYSMHVVSDSRNSLVDILVVSTGCFCSRSNSMIAPRHTEASHVTSTHCVRARECISTASLRRMWARVLLGLMWMPHCHRFFCSHISVPVLVFWCFHRLFNKFQFKMLALFPSHSQLFHLVSRKTSTLTKQPIAWWSTSLPVRKTCSNQKCLTPSPPS